MPKNNQTFKEYIKCKKQVEQMQENLKTKHTKNINSNPRLLQENTTNVQPKDSGNTVNFRARKLLRGHFGKIYAIACSKSNIISTGQDEKIIVWNASTGLKTDVISKTTPQMAIAFSNDGEYIATGGLDNICGIYKVSNTSKSVHELSKHHGYISTCQFISKDLLITSSGDSTCVLWDLQKSSPLIEFTYHTQDVLALDSKPENVSCKNPNIILSCSSDHTVKVWDLRVQMLKHSINIPNNSRLSKNSEYKSSSSGNIMTFYGHDGDVNSVRWFPKYEYTFASGGDDGTTRLWDIRALRQMNVYNAGKSDNSNQSNIKPSVATIEFSNSGFLLFAGFDEAPYCQVFNTLTCEHYGVLLHESRVSDVKLVGTGNGIATGSWDTVLRVWA